LLGKTGSVRRALWPQVGKVDQIVLQQKDFLFNVVHSFRLKKDLHMKPRKKGSDEKIPAPTKASIQVAEVYPLWKQKALTLLKPLYEKSKGNPEDKEILEIFKNDQELKSTIKKAMPFNAGVKEQYKTQGISALDLKLPYDEKEFLNQSHEYIRKALDVKELEIKSADEDSIAKEKSSPGQPSIIFE